MSEPAGPTQVVTFYSYKGGVGRTMALVNTAHVLAREGWRVLMVDFDLEAPGMTYFFAREVRRRPSHVRKDSLDLLLEAKRSLAEADQRKEEPEYPRSLAEYVVPISLPDAWLEKPETGIPYRNGRLDLIPATLELRRSETLAEEEPPLDYVERLGDLDLAGLFLPGGPGHRFGAHVRSYFVNARFEAPGDILFALRNRVQAAYDVVFIDSRTGLNELAGFSIGTVADALVICCGLNNQNIAGTRYFARKIGLFEGSDRAKPFLVAAGPTPPWHTPETEKRLRALRRAMHRRQNAGGPIQDLLDTLEDAEESSLGIAYDFPEMVEIPYHPMAAIRETVFVTELPRDPISRAYNKLAQRVRGRLVPGVVEAAEQYISFLSLLKKPDNERWRFFSDYTARHLPELRLLRRRGTPIPAFPSACGVTSLPSLRDEFRWEDLGRIAVGAAVSSLYLDSSRPFERAWTLLPGLGSKENRSFVTCGLIYFQSSTPYTLPAEGITEWLRDATTDGHRDALSRFSVYLAAEKLISYHPGHLKQEAFDLPKLEEVASAIRSLRSLWRWTKAPIYADVTLMLVHGVLSLARGQLGKDQHAQRYLVETYGLPASPAEVLSGKTDLSKTGSSKLETVFDKASYSNTPLGFWPEPLAATAVALWKGSEAIREILAWFHLARLHYGYAWRVLVDWRYFEDLKQHPELQAFLRQEDEVVAEIEAAIDCGEIPL